ncbi:HEPN domain-containing protein, partial [Spirochaeta lutea]
IIVHYTDSVPRIHNIISLLGTVQNYVKIEIDKKILIMLNQVYADTRYPREIENQNLVLPSKNTSELFKIEAENIFKQTKDILDIKNET